MKTTDAINAFAALAQEHRLAIYRLLVQHGASGLPAGEIADLLRIAPATLSFHLKELTQSRLIISRQEGRFIWYRPDFSAMNKLIAYLCENCCQSSGCSTTAATESIPAVVEKPRRIPRRSS